MSSEPSLELSLYADFFRKLKEPLKDHASVTVEEQGGYYLIEVKPYWTDSLWIEKNKAYRMAVPMDKKELTSKVMFLLVTFTMVIDAFIDTYEDEIPGSMALQSQLMAASDIVEAAWEEMNAPKEEAKQTEETEKKEEPQPVSEEVEKTESEESKPVTEEVESKPEEAKPITEEVEKANEEPAEEKRGFLAIIYNWLSSVVKNSTN